MSGSGRPSTDAANRPPSIVERPDLELGHAQRRRDRHRLATPQDRPDPREQLLAAERLGDVVVGAGVERLDLGQLVGLAGQDDDRDLARPAGDADHLDAVAAGHREVEQHQVGRLLGEPAQGRVAVVRGHDLVAGRADQRGHRADHRGLVVHDEDAQAPRGSTPPAPATEPPVRRLASRSWQCLSARGSASTNRLPPYPFGSIQTRPPIASMSRRAANSPMPEPRERAAVDPNECLEDALPLLARDARSLVGDPHAHVAVVAGTRRCSRRRPVGAYFDSFSRRCSSTWRKRPRSPRPSDHAFGRDELERVGAEQRRQVVDRLADDGAPRRTAAARARRRRRAGPRRGSRRPGDRAA